MNTKPELVRPGLFRDRRDAGLRLAKKLAQYANRPDVIVLALPRGGVPVGYEVARALGAPWMFSLSASSASPATRSWRWARSRLVGCASSTRSS
jgi:hypoxanthine phosphoribosyltransferase